MQKYFSILGGAGLGGAKAFGQGVGFGQAGKSHQSINLILLYDNDIKTFYVEQVQVVEQDLVEVQDLDKEVSCFGNFKFHLYK